MKLATLRIDNTEIAAIYFDTKLFPLKDINTKFELDYPVDLFSLIQSNRLDELNHWFKNEGKVNLQSLNSLAITEDKAQFAPLYRRPQKIWGIGLNYAGHAGSLNEQVPEGEPASFMKPDTSIIGNGDSIQLPALSKNVTGEAELGLIFGKECRNVDGKDWNTVLAGFTSIIDMTAVDILKRNPRNLTQCKSFDTFFSFGPILYTIDEFTDISNFKISTILNGKTHAENIVSNMTFPPDFLVSYHSQIMTMLPGDIISTGTPGAAPLSHGDIIECHIEDFKPLVNKVIDLKLNNEA